MLQNDNYKKIKSCLIEKIKIKIKILNKFIFKIILK